MQMDIIKKCYNYKDSKSCSTCKLNINIDHDGIDMRSCAWYLHWLADHMYLQKVTLLRPPKIKIELQLSLW